MSRSGPKKMNWWYIRILEEMAAAPAKSLRLLAQRLGVTQSWLSTVINSDAFKEAQRSFNEQRLNMISAKLGELADQALGELNRRLHEAPNAIPHEDLRETAKLALKSLGLGAEAREAPQTSVAVSLQLLESAREVIIQELEPTPQQQIAGNVHPLPRATKKQNT